MTTIRKVIYASIAIFLIILLCFGGYAIWKAFHLTSIQMEVNQTNAQVISMDQKTVEYVEEVKRQNTEVQQKTASIRDTVSRESQTLSSTAIADAVIFELELFRRELSSSDKR